MNASDYGFLPSANGEENRNALQRAVDGNLDIEITVPGVYDFEGTLYIPSHRRIRFSDGAVIRRQAEKDA